MGIEYWDHHFEKVKACFSNLGMGQNPDDIIGFEPFPFHRGEDTDCDLSCFVFSLLHDRVQPRLYLVAQ